MLNLKYFCGGCLLRSGTVALMMIALSIFCMHFDTVVTIDGNFVVFIDPGYICNDGTRIRGHQRCNGKTDCPKNEDELGCNRKRNFENTSHTMGIVEDFLNDFKNTVFKAAENISDDFDGPKEEERAAVIKEEFVPLDQSPSQETLPNEEPNTSTKVEDDQSQSVPDENE